MPAIFDVLYREYCRARLAEMRKQLLISAQRHEVPVVNCDAKGAVVATVLPIVRAARLLAGATVGF